MYVSSCMVMCNNKSSQVLLKPPHVCDRQPRIPHSVHECIYVFPGCICLPLLTIPGFSAIALHCKSGFAGVANAVHHTAAGGTAGSEHRGGCCRAATSRCRAAAARAAGVDRAPQVRVHHPRPGCAGSCRVGRISSHLQHCLYAELAAKSQTSACIGLCTMLYPDPACGL
jgi:hypothetical protein